MGQLGSSRRVVFMGTPVFAKDILVAMVSAGHEVPLVISAPDRAMGRSGRTAPPGPVKSYALDCGIEVYQPESLRTEEAIRRIAEVDPEVIVVAAYGKILPPSILNLPPLGCWNVHASILPRWRGAAPIQRAIAAGDEKTGITIMKMDRGLDTGDILLESVVDICPDEIGKDLHDKLVNLGARLILQALDNPEALTPRPQPEEGVTYADKITKQETLIDWSLPADVIERRVRAFCPSPGCHTYWRGWRMKIFRSKVGPKAPKEMARAAPGTVVWADDGSVGVQTGDGVLALHEVQFSGSKRLSIAEFLRGRDVVPGDVFENRGKDN